MNKNDRNPAEKRPDSTPQKERDANKSLHPDAPKTMPTTPAPPPPPGPAKK